MLINSMDRCFLSFQSDRPGPISPKRDASRLVDERNANEEIAQSDPSGILSSSSVCDRRQ